jgi:long-chain acyl-CoA synthetase
MIEQGRQIAATNGLTVDDVILTFLPPGWMCQTLFAYGLALVAGQCICYPKASGTLLESLREIAPTILLTTPRMLGAIMSQVTFLIENNGGIAPAAVPLRDGSGPAQRGLASGRQRTRFWLQVY